MRLMYLQSSYTYARLSFTSSSSFNFNSYVTDDNKYRRVDTSKDHVSVVTTFPKGPPHFCSSSSYIRNFPFVSLFFFFLSCQVEQQLRYLDDRRGLLHYPPPPTTMVFLPLVCQNKQKSKGRKNADPKCICCCCCCCCFGVFVTIRQYHSQHSRMNGQKQQSRNPNNVLIVMYAQQRRSHRAVHTVLFIPFYHCVFVITSRRLLF